MVFKNIFETGKPHLKKPNMIRFGEITAPIFLQILTINTEPMKGLG
jgi:hypothetical protein